MDLEDRGEGLRLGQLQALNALISCWSNWDLSHHYYLTVLIPQIVLTGTFEGATERETVAIAAVREALDDEEWADLGVFVERLYPAEERADAMRRAAAEVAARRAKERADLARQLAGQNAAREQSKRDRLAAIDTRKRGLLQQLDHEIRTDYLGAEKWLSRHDAEGLVSHDELRERQASFVRDWSHRVLGLSLDVEQARSVSAVGRHIKVAARAGSGKTRTLEARALFLMLHCGVPAGQIMLLAFNKAAAEELQQRILGRLGGGSGPLCMTFHAIAYRLVAPRASILSDQGELDRSQSRRVQECVDALLSSPHHFGKLRTLMLSYFKDDWERLVARGDHLPPGEAIDARRHLVRETLRGEYVKSQGERVIANLLLEHGVDYQYERAHDWNGKPYRPDFSVLVDGRVRAVIEYFGMRGDRGYDSQTKKKIEYWSNRPDVRFIGLYPHNVQGDRWGEVQQDLLAALRELGPEFRKRTDEDIWEEVKQRAIDGFTRSMRTLVDRSRQRGWAPDALQQVRAASQTMHPAPDLFVDLGSTVLRDYERSLAENGDQDFAGLLWEAVERLRRGHTLFESGDTGQSGDVSELRHILIDEYQDFSAMFAGLTHAMTATSSAMVFAVGDDWQAINEFAGSDLRYFRDFKQEFDGGVELGVTTNYRSARSIVERGNQLMAQYGQPAIAGSSEVGWIGRADVASFTPNLYEETQHRGDRITPALVRVVADLLRERKEVAILTRFRAVSWVQSRQDSRMDVDAYRRHLLRFLPTAARDLLHVSTAHAFKGKEADAVIVLQANDGEFPFIHPATRLFSVFGDSPQTVLEAERRLFYVATTRARERLLYFYDSEVEISPFVTAMEENQGMPNVDLANFRAPSTGDMVEIRVEASSKASEPLKQAGFRWNARHRCWSLAVRASDAPSPNGRERWRRPEQRVTLCSDDGAVLWVVPPS